MNKISFSTRGKALILLGFSAFWIIYNSLGISDYNKNEQQKSFKLYITMLSITLFMIIYQYLVLPRIKNNKKTLFIPYIIALLSSTILMIVNVTVLSKTNYIDSETENILMWVAFGLYIFGNALVINLNYRDYIDNNYYNLPY